jgi:hypothetical protein
MAVVTMSHVSKRFAHGPVLDDGSMFCSTVMLSIARFTC